MTEPNRDHSELEELLLEWEFGSLDADGVERVRSILRDDADARQFYIRHQLVSAALTAEAATSVTGTESPRESGQITPVRFRSGDFGESRLVGRFDCLRIGSA